MSSGRMAVPWPSPASARAFLGSLADTTSRPGESLDSLARWLIDHQLGPLAFHVYHDRPGADRELRRNAHGVAASSLSHDESLARIEDGFARSGIPVVLLKGAAVSTTAWGDPALRPMSDLDLWVRDEDLAEAGKVMRALGFLEVNVNPDRPDELKKISRGELQFRLPGRAHEFVELQRSPFKGWWAVRTAAVNEEEIWRRADRPVPGRHARTLSPEDQILHIAFDTAVSQFVPAPVRSLMDIALIARSERVDWAVLAERACRFRLRTLTWTVLDLAERLIGVPGSQEARALLRPRASRRLILGKLLPPASVLARKDFFASRSRYLVLLALVDRFRDMARLVLRAVWPDRRWLRARYGRPVGRARHMWRLLRHGEI